ncbi:MAG TPA: type IV pilus assembly protein PilM [Armatimonadota bacterium]|jgi:type IV pilus assembly protein PilM
MAFGLAGSKSTATLGIDVGHESIKIVEAQGSPGSIQIALAETLPTPASSVADGLITDPEAVGAAIKEFLRSIGAKATQAVAGVAGPQVNVRPIPMPRMSEADVRRSIVWEAQKHFSFAPEETIVEGEVLRSDDPDAAEMFVMVVTAPRSQVDGQVLALEAAGLEPIVVDIGVFAKVRSLLEFPRREEDLSRTVALVDMGASYTEVSIIQSGLPVWMRVIPLGGSALTRPLVESMAMELADATVAKEQMDAERLGHADDLSTSEALVQNSLEELMREVRRSINFYNSQMEASEDAVAIERVYLLGGASQMQGMAAYLGESLRLEVIGGELGGTDRLKGKPEAEMALYRAFPTYAQALGLAMWEILSSKQKHKRRGR